MVQFSKEPNNLYNVNTFKHSGLATAKTISVQAGKDSGIVLATIKTNKQKYPSALVHKTVMKLGNIPCLLVKLSERVLELLVLPGDDVLLLLLDIGCGSRLSGETLSESGNQWIGLDMSDSMRNVALERDVEGDLLLSDMCQKHYFHSTGTFLLLLLIERNFVHFHRSSHKSKTEVEGISWITISVFTLKAITSLN
ncbi:hypothetical protein C5167_018364 [Papaver somniferum]|uniref:Ribosomal eL28/Mak16 domain-containing protein n=1 Tax=Papaver somniferum TaxID=3469 RepID=A0A4Y7IM18_PAPSO|nr:hypothetical protein C5167_018364 [Papaver somniferum]